MSPDEVFALLVCGVIALVGWVLWFRAVVTATPLGTSHGRRAPLYLAPLICGVAILIVLRLFASHDVRDSPTYIFFYLVMGAAWVAAAVRLLPLLGITPRDDAVERRNAAAVVTVAGAMLGITFCFAGGNIGDGPGWWVVVFSAILSTATLPLLWAIIQMLTPVSDSITIDRDLASGVRLAGFLIAAGLILGRAVAGNWISLHATVIDFARIGWPAVPLAVGEIFLSRLFRPTPQHPVRPVVACGLVPAMVYLSAAVVYVMGIGRW